MPIRAITFDFWRTLFRDENAGARHLLRVAAFMKATGCPENAVRDAVNEAGAAFQRYHIENKRTLGPHDLVRMVTESLGAPVTDGVFEQLARFQSEVILQQPPAPIEGALDAVRAAASRYPTAIASDTGMSPGRSLRALLDKHGFSPHFTTTVFSDEVGVAKPHAGMFETAARNLGVQPNELLHIGDLEFTDIQGAHGVGAQAALFAGDNPRHIGETTAERTFLSWQEFIDTLPSLD